METSKYGIAISRLANTKEVPIGNELNSEQPEAGEESEEERVDDRIRGKQEVRKNGMRRINSLHRPRNSSPIIYNSGRYRHCIKRLTPRNPPTHRVERVRKSRGGGEAKKRGLIITKCSRTGLEAIWVTIGAPGYNEKEKEKLGVSGCIFA